MYISGNNPQTWRTYQKTIFQFRKPYKLVLCVLICWFIFHEALSVGTNSVPGSTTAKMMLISSFLLDISWFSEIGFLTLDNDSGRRANRHIAIAFDYCYLHTFVIEILILLSWLWFVGIDVCKHEFSWSRFSWIQRNGTTQSTNWVSTGSSAERMLSLSTRWQRVHKSSFSEWCSIWRDFSDKQDSFTASLLRPKIVKFEMILSGIG